MVEEKLKLGISLDFKTEEDSLIAVANALKDIPINVDADDIAKKIASSVATSLTQAVTGPVESILLAFQKNLSQSLTRVSQESVKVTGGTPVGRPPVAPAGAPVAPVEASAAAPPVKSPEAAAAIKGITTSFSDTINAFNNAAANLTKSLPNLDEASKQAATSLKTLARVGAKAGKLEKVVEKLDTSKENESTEKLSTIISAITGAKKIAAARDKFIHLSMLVISLLEHNKYEGEQKAFVFHCPMAADGKGANWLQNTKDTKNPYYGKSMLACGSKTKTIKK